MNRPLQHILQPMFACVLLVALVLSGGCASVPIEAKTTLGQNDVGTIHFNSAKPLIRPLGRQDYSSGKTSGFALSAAESIAVFGELNFPPGQGPFPAVVVVHGCAGTGYSDKAWAPVLREWGYATFVVDSFRPRGYSSICDNLGRLQPLERLPDVYGALAILSTHPNIDPTRIALMGASHGGALTIQASTKWAKDTFAPNKNGFRAFFALYPFCNVHVPEWKSIYAPIRIHAGELDDWTPAKPCEQYVASLKTSGQDADIHVYPRAHHSFDDPSQQFFYGPQMQSPAKCSFHGSSILDPLTMEPPSCFSRGATNGRNFPAIGSVRENVRSELSKLLR